MVLLLWASKFVTSKIQSSFGMGKKKPLGVLFILLLMVPNFDPTLWKPLNLRDFLFFSWVLLGPMEHFGSVRAKH